MYIGAQESFDALVTTWYKALVVSLNTTLQYTATAKRRADKVTKDEVRTKQYVDITIVKDFKGSEVDKLFLNSATNGTILSIADGAYFFENVLVKKATLNVRFKETLTLEVTAIAEVQEIDIFEQEYTDEAGTLLTHLDVIYSNFNGITIDFNVTLENENNYKWNHWGIPAEPIITDTTGKAQQSVYVLEHDTEFERMQTAGILDLTCTVAGITFTLTKGRTNFQEPVQMPNGADIVRNIILTDCKPTIEYETD